MAVKVEAATSVFYQSNCAETKQEKIEKIFEKFFQASTHIVAVHVLF